MPLFFLAACSWAAIAIPLWLAARADLVANCGLCSTSSGHAASLLAGYALAVIAGFLVHRPSPAMNAALLLTWLLARLPGFLALPPALAVAAMLPFPLLLLQQTVPRFFKAAKGGHNRIFAPILVVLVGLVTALETATSLGRTLAPALPQGAVLIIGLLLFEMGGRIIPAATAGALRAKSRHLKDRVQRPLEWSGLVGLALGITALLLGLKFLAGPALLLAGLAAFVRLVRWRGIELLDRPDIWGLHLGYAWLAGGLVLAGLEVLALAPWSSGIHALMIGGLGTLAATMMARTVRQRARRPSLFGRLELVVLLFLSLAAAARVASAAIGSEVLLVIAGAAWSTSHILLLPALALSPPQRPRTRQG